MDLMQYITKATEQRAADLFIIAGAPCCMRMDKTIQPLDDQKLFPADTQALVEELYRLAHREMSKFYQTWDDDFSFAVPGLARFRVNTYRQRGSMAAVIRVVSFTIPDWREIHILPQIMDLSKLTRGMVLVTGAADSGKSTTLACLIDEINKNGMTVLIVEQNSKVALHHSQYAYVIDDGKITMEGRSEDLANDPRIVEAYLGKKKEG